MVSGKVGRAVGTFASMVGGRVDRVGKGGRVGKVRGKGRADSLLNAAAKKGGEVTQRCHKVWKVRIGSLNDARPHGDGRMCLSEVPERAVYYIEKSRLAERRALQAAVDDAIPRPVVLGMEWENCPFTKREKQ